ITSLQTQRVSGAKTTWSYAQRLSSGQQRPPDRLSSVGRKKDLKAVLACVARTSDQGTGSGKWKADNSIMRRNQGIRFKQLHGEWPLYGQGSKTLAAVYRFDSWLQVRVEPGERLRGFRSINY